MSDSIAIVDRILRGTADMILSIGYVQGKIDALSAFTDGKVRQELLNAKSSLAGIVDDLISMTEGDE